MNFDDREKKLDRHVNRAHIEYQKFLNKETCPTCNCSEPLVGLRDMTFDKKKRKYVTRKWIHDDQRCFKWFGGLVLALKKETDGKYVDSDKLEKIIDHAYKALKSFDKKFKEKQE